jgi:hypothetical protein
MTYKYKQHKNERSFELDQVVHIVGLPPIGFEVGDMEAAIDYCIREREGWPLLR